MGGRKQGYSCRSANSHSAEFHSQQKPPEANQRQAPAAVELVEIKRPVHVKRQFRASVSPKKSQNQCGYTLFESLIALAILITVVVPLTTLFHRKADAARLARSIAAACILEQEAALAAAFPQDVAPVKRRQIDGKEWTVRTGASGSGPIVYKMIVAMNGRAVDSVFFYGRKADAAK